MGLRYTLLCDGPSDRALIPILDFLLRVHGATAIQSAWADLRRIRDQPRNLTEKIEICLQFYPCDLLFIHRDAEKEETVRRYEEIAAALRITKTELSIPFVCVVPKRMTEAWLLIEEQALRRAVGNPNGKVKLTLPPLHQLEHLSDPKEDLYALLREASELHGRRLKQFSTMGATQLVAEYIEDFSPLRRLLSFQALESDLRAITEREGWSIDAD